MYTNFDRNLTEFWWPMVDGPWLMTWWVDDWQMMTDDHCALGDDWGWVAGAIDDDWWMMSGEWWMMLKMFTDRKGLLFED